MSSAGMRRPSPDAFDQERHCKGNAMKQYLKRISVGAAALLGALAFGQAASAQEKTEISITRQPGILYLPSHVIEKQKLIEKYAAQLGVENVTTKWITFSGGGAQT